MKFIGIDLAWTYKNETGLCIMNSEGEVDLLDSQIYTNEDLVKIINEYHSENLTIAIDAPLIVKNDSGSRGAEGEMMRAKINGHRVSAFNANRNYFMKVFGEIRGETLMHMIRAERPDIEIGFSRTESCIVETFPTGIVLGLFPEISPVKYKHKPKQLLDDTISEMRRLLARFDRLQNEGTIITNLKSSLDTEITTQKSLKHLEDKVDAFLSAFGMYALGKNMAEARTFGTVERGFITVPVTSGKGE